MRFVHAATLILALAACNRNGGNGDSSDAGPADTLAGGEAARRPAISDAEALAVLRAAGAVAINTASVAQEISESAAITGYAHVVIADQRGIAQLIDAAASRLGQPPRDNVISTTIRLQGDSIARGLTALTGGFNNTFIEEQVRSYQHALQLLDTLLIPSARDSSVKHLLDAIRPAYAAHMQRAMQILAERRRAAAEQGDEWISGFQPPAAADTVPPAPQPVPRPLPADTTTPPPDTAALMRL